MGCSYDHPAPNPEEVRLGNDRFSYQRFGLNSCVVCLDCGAVLSGSPQERRFIDLHMRHCPARRSEIRTPPGITQDTKEDQ